MDRSDVSFTFLDRIREIEENIEDGRFQSALALAVTLFDICGGIAFPELVKRGRDGRILAGQIRGAQPGHRAAVFPVGGYIRGPVPKKDPADEAPYICGERLWQPHASTCTRTRASTTIRPTRRYGSIWASTAAAASGPGYGGRIRYPPGY